MNRDSSREPLLKGYKKVLLKVHPDKGGCKGDAQKLQTARENWDAAQKSSSPKAGRPSAMAADGALVCQTGGKSRKDFRVCAAVVLLTYQGFADQAQWHRFVDFCRKSLKKWGGALLQRHSRYSCRSILAVVPEKTGGENTRHPTKP